MSDNPGELDQLDPVGNKVTGRNMTVAQGRNKRVFWVDDDRDVLIREVAALQRGNRPVPWKEMAASIAASGQLDKTADQIRGHVHTQRFKKAWDRTHGDQPLHELVPPAQARKKRPRKKSHVSPCLSVFLLFMYGKSF